MARVWCRLLLYYAYVYVEIVHGPRTYANIPLTPEFLQE